MINIWLLPVFLLDTIPFSYFQFVFLKRDLRYKLNAATFVFWLLITVAVGAGCFGLTCLPFYNDDALRYLRLLNCCILLVILLFSTKTAKSKVLLIFSVTTPFSLGFSIIAAFISQYTRGDTPLYMVSSIIRFAIILVLYPFMVWMWRKFGKESDRITDPTVWRYLWLIPASTAVSELVLMDRNFEVEGISISDMIGRVILWFGSIAVCWLLIFLAGRFEMRIHLQETNERNETLLALQRQQYAEIAERIERARALRHDIRHHTNAMKSLSESKEYDKLDAYLSELSGSIVSDHQITICENYAANAIMDSYIRKAQELDIPIKINFRLSNQSGISDSDLCVLLGNIVENALEAASKSEPDKRFISINALEENDRIYMTFDNSYCGNLQKNENGFLSAKRGFASTGIGFASINAVIKKYSGDMKIETEDNVFKLSVMINKKGTA